MPVPVDGVLDLELGFDVRSVSDMIPMGGCGERAGRWDICEPERDDGGRDDSEVLRVLLLYEAAPCPFPLLIVLERYGSAVWAAAIVDSPGAQGRRGVVGGRAHILRGQGRCVGQGSPLILRLMLSRCCATGTAGSRV